VSALRLNGGLALLLLVLAAAGLLLGETQLSGAQYAQAFHDLASAPAQVLWEIRAPRTACAAVVGAALGLSGAVMQGLLRNPLADPGVLGVSGGAGLGAAIAIAAGLGATSGIVEAAALAAAMVVGLLLTALALTSLVFNVAPSPVTLAEVFAWLLGSVANRDWGDIGRELPPLAAGAALCLYAARGLVMLSLGEESAAMSGLPMARLRAAAVAGASLLAGAAVAMAGIVGFVGLAAPHLVRARAAADPGRILLPSALAGAALLMAADMAARLIPTDQELKLGVVTALFGAPLFAMIAWRAARSWRG
jgi:iron complex transport system permease protein